MTQALDLQEEAKKLELRKSIREKLQLQKTRILKRAPMELAIPAEDSKIRALCVSFYERKDPWFAEVRAEVDLFVQELQGRLKDVGLEDTKAFDVAHELVTLGMSALVKSTSNGSTFLHHFAWRTPQLYGAPLLAEHLESLMLLDQLVTHLVTTDENDPNYQILFLQAFKLRKLIVKGLARPAGGLPRTARRQKVDQYKAIIGQGWKRMMFVEANGHPRRTPKVDKPEAVHPRHRQSPEVVHEEQLAEGQARSQAEEPETSAPAAPAVKETQV
jgi:hypothetical protein